MSEFDDLPLPSTRDHADYPRIVPPGQTVEIPAVGDFIYCKASDSELKVTINGKTTRMEVGDKRRVGSVFRGVVLENTSDVAVVCTFVIGFGDFDRVIVRGEITAELKLRTADGSYIDDTRKTLDLDVLTVPGAGITENYFDTVATLMNGGLAAWADITFPNGEASYRPTHISYNPSVHEWPIVLAPSTTTSRDFVYSFDPQTGKMVRFFGEFNDADASGGYTRFGSIEYKTQNAGTKGVYRRIGGITEPWELYVQFQSQGAVAAHVFSDGALLVLHSNSAFSIIDSEGAVVAGPVFPTSFNIANVVTFDSDDNFTLFSSGNAQPRIYNKNGVEIGRLDTAAVVEPGFGYGPYLLYVESVGAGSKILVKALETVSNLFAGKAFLACENSWLGFRPDAFKAIRSTANIEVFNAESGNPTVSGEIIKLLYEWYTGENAPIDYLDYIHGVEIFGSSDINGSYFRPIKIISNGQTFLAAGIPDNFSVIFPITAKITVDNRAGV